MVSHTFGEEIGKSRLAPTSMAQLIIDLRKMGSVTAPHVSGPEGLRDHLDRCITALQTLRDRAADLAAPAPVEPEEKSQSKRKAAKGKDRQETGGTDRSDSD